jgi:EpsI family protein
VSRVETWIGATLLIAVGAFAWAVALRAPLRVDASRLAGLPLQLDEWRAVEVPIDGPVEQMLDADFNVQRLYRDPDGNRLWLYVGYYGTGRGGRPEHTPRACYEAHGWKIRERRVVAASGDPPLRVNEYVVERDGERHLVHFWFRSARATGLLGAWDQALDHVIGRIHDERADGSLVRLSARLGEGTVESERSRLLRFATRLDAQLGAHWPEEIAARPDQS